MSDQPETPAHVQKLANEAAHLPRRAVLGIFGSESNLSALIRTRSGEIARITVGDTVEGGTVQAIDNTRVLISHSGRARVLKLIDG